MESEQAINEGGSGLNIQESTELTTDTGVEIIQDDAFSYDGSDQEKPIILIDLKKNRIRLHKKTLRSIGVTDYVLLLVNPAELTLAILPGDRSDPRAHHISASLYANHRTVDLYSRSLIASLRNVCNSWQDKQS